MDVSKISVIAINPSVDSGSRERPPQRHREDPGDRDAQESGLAAEPAADAAEASDMPATDGPDLVPAEAEPPRLGRYVNKVV